MRIVSVLFLAWLALATWGIGSTLVRRMSTPAWLHPATGVWV
jgi:hypothetical protein